MNYEGHLTAEIVRKMLKGEFEIKNDPKKQIIFNMPQNTTSNDTIYRKSPIRLIITEADTSKNLVKGKTPHCIPLTDAAMEILQLWRKKNYNDRFVFNLLHPFFDLSDAETLDKKIKSQNRTLQTSLNTIGDKMGLPC